MIIEGSLLTYFLSVFAKVDGGLRIDDWLFKPLQNGIKREIRIVTEISNKFISINYNKTYRLTS